MIGLLVCLFHLYPPVTRKRRWRYILRWCYKCPLAAQKWASFQKCASL